MFAEVGFSQNLYHSRTFPHTFITILTHTISGNKCILHPEKEVKRVIKKQRPAKVDARIIKMKHAAIFTGFQFCSCLRGGVADRHFLTLILILIKCDKDLRKLTS